MREIGLAREKVRTEIHLCAPTFDWVCNSTLIWAACAWLCGPVVCVFYSREQHLKKQQS